LLDPLQHPAQPPDAWIILGDAFLDKLVDVLLDSLRTLARASLAAGRGILIRFLSREVGGAHHESHDRQHTRDHHMSAFDVH
jgi:hypothetical protein